MTATTVETPVLASIANVELIRCGTWDISNGTWTVETADLEQAIAAMDCPAVRRPVLKLGHTDPRFDGEPAVGWVDNLALTDNGQTLVGDYVGMPAWLAEVAPSAYPDRSIEGMYDFVCQVGHVHPFVLKAVAFLGVTPPGIGNLESLQDVAALYGVAASTTPARGVTLHLAGGPPMPRPVQAAVSVEDVRRDYYEKAPWELWICEVQLEPLQLIVCDDNDGDLTRVPVTVGADDKITFGAPIAVKRVYEDVPADDDADDVAASTAVTAATGRVRYASRELSRPGQPHKSPAATAAGSEEGAATMDGAQLREALGLAPDASQIEVAAKLAAEGHIAPAASTDPAPVTPPAPTAPAPTTDLPEGLVAVDSATLEELKVAASQGAAARTQQLAESRENAIAAAVRTGKIPPSRREHYAAAWDADPEGTKTLLDTLAPGLVPVEASGYAGTDGEDLDAEYRGLFGAPATKEG